MTRDEAIESLNKYRPLALSVGVEMFDFEDFLKPVVDAALRALGLAEADLAEAIVADNLTADYLALLNYYMLDLLRVKHIVAVDVTIGDLNFSKKRSQIWDHLQILFNEAKQMVQTLGYSVGGSDFILGEIDTSYIEPLDGWEM